jgi:hypothetical protein
LPQAEATELARPAAAPLTAAAPEENPAPEEDPLPVELSVSEENPLPGWPLLGA